MSLGLLACHAHLEVHQHTDPHVDLIVVHIEPPGAPKYFNEGRPFPGGLVMETPPKPWPLYNRVRLLEAEEVVVVEGDK